jgi:hypothetical protein
MFTLEQNIFIVQCYFRNGEKPKNGKWSYSTPRVFEELQQKFPDFQGTYQQLAQKVYKCLNMFLETGSVLRRTAENIEEVEQRIADTPNKFMRRLTQETNLSFGTVQLILKKDLHFFLIVCLLCMKLNPLTIRALTT